MQKYAVIFQSFGDVSKQNDAMHALFSDAESVIQVYEDKTTTEAKMQTRTRAGISYVDIAMPEENGGPLCSTLMAVAYIDNGNSLLLVGDDLSPDFNVAEVVSQFEKAAADCGVVVKRRNTPSELFASLYDNNVTMFTNTPGSGMALESFFYFQHGRDFITAAKTHIMNGKRPSDKFEIYNAANEMILEGKNVVVL